MNKKHTDFVHTSKWFAWYPVWTKDKGFTWWKLVTRIQDDRDEEYLGLLSITQYYDNIPS